MDAVPLELLQMEVAQLASSQAGDVARPIGEVAPDNRQKVGNCGWRRRRQGLQRPRRGLVENLFGGCDRVEHRRPARNLSGGKSGCKVRWRSALKIEGSDW